MRVQLMSDLHFEFHQDGGQAFVASLDPTGVDVLVLAGDIGLCADGSLQAGLGFLSERYSDAQIVMAAGNHEFYHSTREEVEATRQKMTALYSNLHWLENSSVTINGQRFLGCTLWFIDQPDGLNHHYCRSMGDQLIQGFYSWVYEANKASMRYLQDNVREGDIVVTHYIPTQEGVHPRWRPSSKTLGRFFLCQMPYSVLEIPSYWFFGHTHDTMAFEIGNCKFRCNPLGYPMESRPSHFIEKLVMGDRDSIQCTVCGHTFEVDSDALDLSDNHDARCPECGAWALQGETA